MELDFQYPSEGIHRRWDAAFRITCCAATSDQAAFVLSLPKNASPDETQARRRDAATRAREPLQRCAPCAALPALSFPRPSPPVAAFRS